MPTSTSTFRLNVSAIKDLCQGTGILYGYTSPTTEGITGDFFLNIASISAYQLYGPKTTTWPVTGVTITTVDYLTSYTQNAINTALTGGSELANTYLKNQGIPGFGLLSALEIKNVDTRPHISASSYGVNNFTVDYTGDIEGRSLTLTDFISANTSLAEWFSNTNAIYGSFITGDLTNEAVSGSHAEGLYTQVSAQYAHAEGNTTRALGNYSHAEGTETLTLGEGSHAQGFSNNCLGNYSFAAGTSAVAYHDYSFVWSAANGIEGISSSLSNQFVAYGSNYVHLGSKLGVNTFSLSSGVIVEGVSYNAYIPNESLPATLTVNGTVSAASLSAASYHDSAGSQLLTVRQALSLAKLDPLSATTSDIATTLNTIIDGLTAHGLIT